MKTAILEPGDSEYDELDSRLVAFNKENTAWDTEVFTVILRSEDGVLRGGARGIVRMQAVELRGLWLDRDLRSQGLGARIVAAVEAEARRRGAKSVLLDTYSFQALEFYGRLGYSTFGSFAYPNGVERYYMTRQLSD